MRSPAGEQALCHPLGAEPLGPLARNNPPLRIAEAHFQQFAPGLLAVVEAICAVDPARCRFVNPGRGADDRYLAGQRFEHSEAKPFSLGRDDDGVRGVDPERNLLRFDRTERQQLGVAAFGNCLRTIEALSGPRRVRWKKQIATIASKAKAGTGLLAIERPEAIGRNAAGKNLNLSPRVARHLSGQLWAGGADEIDQWQRRLRDQSRTTVAQVGAVQRQSVKLGRDYERRPGGQAKVGVHNIEALLAIFAPQITGRGAVAARGEGETLQLQVGIFERTQRLELITDEAAELRPLGRGPHVGDDQNTHLVLIVHLVAVDPRNATLQAAVRAVPKPLGASMAYRLQGRIHATFHHVVVRLSSPSGQGTVEYVALILLVAGVLAGVIVAGKSLKGGGIAQTVVSKLKESIDSVGSAKP